MALAEVADMTARNTTLILVIALILPVVAGCSKARKDSISACNHGIERLQSGEINEAQDAFEKAIRLYPRNQIAHFQLGTLLMLEKKDYAGARREYSTAIDLNPRDAEAVYMMGRLELQEDNMDAALMRFQEALRIDPAHAGSLHYSGVVMQKKGKLDEADELFRAAIAANPRYARSFNSLGLMYYETGNYDQAIAVFKEGVRLSPDDADLHHNLGLAYLTVNEVDKAVDELLASLELDPENSTAAFNVANALIRQQKFKTASFFLSRLIVTPDLDDPDLLEPAKLIYTSLQNAMAQGIGLQ